MDIFPLIQNPCPHLLELYLEISNIVTAFDGIDGLNNFPSLKSLTLIGDISHLRFSQPYNLRKLGVSCNGTEFRLASLLELLAKIPLLEEFELFTPDEVPTIIEANPPTPVPLTHLKRIVFRGTRSDFPRILTPLIAYPKDTKLVLTHCRSYGVLRSPAFHSYHPMFPSGTQLLTTSAQKYIRYREVYDGDASEARFSIDLISVDGQHTSIENRYNWADSSSQGGRPFESDRPQMECLGFIRALDLSFVERFCVELCIPDPSDIGEVMEGMINLGTLVVVNGYPHGIFLGLELDGAPFVRCPLLRRLVVRQDVTVYIDWHVLLPVIEGRAAHGSPLERVTLTSSFNELLEEPEEYVQLLERTTEVTFDLGRNTFGWEWWKV